MKTGGVNCICHDLKWFLNSKGMLIESASWLAKMKLYHGALRALKIYVSKEPLSALL